MSARHSYCITCLSARHLSRLRFALFGLAVFTIVGLVMVSTTRNSEAGWSLLNLVLLYMFGFVTTVFHEFGHALTGKLVGMRIQGVIIGAGPTFWQTRLFGFPVIFKTFALGGGRTLVTYSSLKWLRLRQAMLFLAGPVTNLVIAAMLLWLLPATALASFPKGTGLFPVMAFICANLLVFIVNLLPIRYATEDGALKSDGLQLLSLPFQKQRDFSSGMAGHFLILGAERLMAKNYVGARDASLKGLHTYAQLDETRAYLLNRVAWCDLLLDKPELLKEAMTCATEAMQLAPDSVAIKGTLGSVLIESGEHERGLALLLESNAKVERDADRASNMCYVAIAYQHVGDMSKAHEAIHAVEVLDPDCVLLERARRMVG